MGEPTSVRYKKDVRRFVMRLLSGIALSVVSIIVFAGAACGQDRIVPAGTLLQCVIDEPNFSSATAAVGDPLVCHLRALDEFGKPAFPQGAMLGGHLEDAKDPGRLWGKGYLKLTFDRVILPYGELPVPTKVIHAQGFKVSKSGNIDGKGHAKRDLAEWMIPPLWPWKLVSLPMRGPRPRLKGEEQLELRTMDNVLIPTTLAYGQIKPDRSPYMGTAQRSALVSDSAGKLELGLTMLVLKSDEVYAIRRFHLDSGVLKFEDLNGAAGVVDANQIDWLRTAEMTSTARSTLFASSRVHIEASERSSQ